MKTLVKCPVIDEIELDNKLQFFTIEPEDVRTKLDNLNPSKSPGPDNIHPRHLKEMSSVIQRPLTILYQNTLKCGEIPEEWKHARVTAIFKKEGRKNPNNYRPVILTCITCKIMELLI